VQRFIALVAAFAFAGSVYAQGTGEGGSGLGGGTKKPPTVALTKPKKLSDNNVIDWAFTVTVNGNTINSAKLEIIPTSGGQGYTTSWTSPMVSGGQINMSGSSPNLPPGPYLVQVTVTYNQTKIVSDRASTVLGGAATASFGTLSTVGKLTQNGKNFNLNVQGAYTAPANSGYTTKNVQVTVTPQVQSGGGGPTYNTDFPMGQADPNSPRPFSYYAQVDVFDSNQNFVATVYSNKGSGAIDPPKKK
jgi:hypothetical protein